MSNPILCPECNRRATYLRPYKDQGKWYRCVNGHRFFVHNDKTAEMFSNSPPPPTDPRKTYFCYEHQGKQKAFVEALRSHGYFQTPVTTGIAFILADADVLGRVTRFERIHNINRSVKFFVYPHAARPDLAHDGFGGNPFTTATFVVSKEHAEVLRIIGHKEPLHVVGWSLCPIQPFIPHSSYENVLFAPIHPRNSMIDKRANQAVMDRLVTLAKADRIKLTVRFISSLPETGITRVDHPNIIYTAGTRDNGHEQIDAADVVVSHQTFAWIAVARGVPTVMMAEDMVCHWEVRPGKLIVAKTWDRYKHMLMYPLDILQVDDTVALLEHAISTDEDIHDWKRRMIGDAFDHDKFIEIVESYLK